MESDGNQHRTPTHGSSISSSSSSSNSKLHPHPQPPPRKQDYTAYTVGRVGTQRNARLASLSARVVASFQPATADVNAGWRQAPVSTWLRITCNFASWPATRPDRIRVCAVLLLGRRPDLLTTPIAIPVSSTCKRTLGERGDRRARGERVCEGEAERPCFGRPSTPIPST